MESRRAVSPRSEVSKTMHANPPVIFLIAFVIAFVALAALVVPLLSHAVQVSTP